MALTSQMSLGSGFGTAVDPQTKRLKNERKRIIAYIRQYERDPGSWSKSMLAQLEQLSMQYQVPFKRKVADASAGSNLFAFGGGLVDSALFDFIPDDWYSNESTRKAANYGKIGGSAAQILAAIGATIATGGLAAPTIGAAAKGLGTAVTGVKGVRSAMDIAKAAGKLAVTIPARTPLGMMTGGAARGAMQATAPHFAGKGVGWAENLLRTQGRGANAKILVDARNKIKAGGGLEDVVSGQTLTSDQTRLLANQIARKYSTPTGKLTNTGKSLAKQLNTANQTGDVVIGSMKGMDFSKFADKIHTATPAGTNLSVDNIMKVAGRARIKMDTKDAQTLYSYLDGRGHTKLSDAVGDIIALGAKNISKGFPQVGIGEIDKLAAGSSALGLGFATTQPFRSRIKSREELDSAFTDPYDPYNQA